jgi:excisionase family DNA binding protein
MTSESPYRTVPEVAAYLRVSVPTVYRWVEQDATFPAVKIHGTVRVNHERLLRWLRDREQGHRGHTAHRMNKQVHADDVTGTSAPLEQS